MVLAINRNIQERTASKQFHWKRLLLILIMLMATALRFTQLGYQSEWNDEAISAVIASGTTWQILTNQFHSLHPPGYYLVLHIWLNVFGDSDFMLRIPSALMGIAGVMLMYLLGKTLFKVQTGLWAAAITALMPFHLFYSQEMRMYSQLFLLAALAVLCQVKIWRRRGQKWWVVYVVVALLGLYSHYLFTLIVGVLASYFMWRRWVTSIGPSWKNFFLAHITIGILYLPIIFWLQDQVSQSSDYWIKAVSLALFLSIPLSFTVGQFLDLGWLQVGYALVLMIMMITLLQAGRAIKQKETGFVNLILILTIYWLPVLIIFTVSIFWTPLTQARLMTVAVPGLYLLIAWGATLPKERIVNVILITLLIFVALVADYNWLFNPAYSKPPAKDAAFFLRKQALPGEAIVYTSDSGFRLFWRYVPELDHRLFLENNDNPQIRPEVFKMMGGDIVTFEHPLTETFWLILYQDFDAEKQEAIFHRFDECYAQLGNYNIGGIRMYRYRRPSENVCNNVAK